MSKMLTHAKTDQPLVNYLRVHRRRAGLSQRELGRVLGYDDEGAVSRHERFYSLPPLLIALGYEVIFGIPISEMFPGLRETVELSVGKSLAEFEDDLRMRSDTGSQVTLVTRKLEWLTERRSSRYK